MALHDHKVLGFLLVYKWTNAVLYDSDSRTPTIM